MSTAEGGTTAEMVDWQLATGVARKLLRPGPVVSRAEADQVVAQLRQFATDSEHHVREFTGLQATSATAPVVIVDRPGWVQANADGFRTVLAPLADKLREKQEKTGGLSSAVGSRVTAIEAGALLAFLSSRVLGQFDPFYPAQPDPGRPGLTGRLLLVAPNVMHVENELGVVPRDFRLWVCLHEETHRVQFTAVPWLRDHLRSEIALFLDQAELDASAYAAMFREAVQRLGRSVKGEADLSLVDLMQSPEQRAVLDRLTAVMSLLEGHADFVMDGVGPSVIPTVDTIRSKFTARRSSGNPVDQLLKRLLGLDAKLKQYQDGAAFVRRVSTGSAWRASTRSGPARTRCPPRTRSPPRMPGSADFTAESVEELVDSRRGKLHPAVARVREGVRSALADLPAGTTVLVACSGGADSLALAAATAFEAPKLGLRAGAVIVDHGLQADSSHVAAVAADQCRSLGLDPVEVRAVEVGSDGGPEGAARTARYDALRDAADAVGADVVLLGHTRDDQAETVLLGLARGSGARSLAGMASVAGLLRRPLLEVPRATTAAACIASGLRPWHDPHNDDPQYRRVRVRHEVLPVIEEALGPGVTEALARTAGLLRADADALDALAADLAETAVRRTGEEVVCDLGMLAAEPQAIRTRVLRQAALEAGCHATDLTAGHVAAVDALITDWRGQRWIDLPQAIRAIRRGGFIHLARGVSG